MIMSSTGDLIVSLEIENIRKLPRKHRIVKTKQCRIQILMTSHVTQVVNGRNVTKVFFFALKDRVPETTVLYSFIYRRIKNKTNEHIFFFTLKISAF